MPDLEIPDLPNEDEWTRPHWWPINLDEPPIEVKHSELTLWNDDSYFKRCCRWCPNGVLLVRRDPKTAQIIAEDSCIGCAQKVIYTDIEELKAVFKHPKSENEIVEFMRGLRDQYQEDQKKTPEGSGEPATTEESED